MKLTILLAVVFCILSFNQAAVARNGCKRSLEETSKFITSLRYEGIQFWVPFGSAIRDKRVQAVVSMNNAQIDRSGISDALNSNSKIPADVDFSVLFKHSLSQELILYGLQNCAVVIETINRAGVFTTSPEVFFLDPMHTSLLDAN